jgi:protocatechuate 3,4-dioxygenase beta subunit
MATSRGLRGELSDEAIADELTITLTPEHILRGIVFGPTGRPIAGAEIQVNSSYTESDYNRTHVQGVWQYTPGDIRTSTRSDGHFELRGLASGSYFVEARCAPYLVRRQYLRTGSRIHEITLDVGLSLRGRVLTADGLPAEGARVRFWPYTNNTHGVDLFACCDEDGEFHLVGMGREKAGVDTVMNDPPFAIAIEHRGHALHVLQPVVPGPNGGEYVRVRLEPEHVLGGYVVDDSGTPVPGARVSIEGDRDMETGVSWGRRNTWEFCFGIADTQTDLQGRFRFDRLYPGEFTILAVSPWDPNQAVRTTRRSGDESVELVFGSSEGSGVVLFGGVQDGRTGQAVSTFQVVPMIGGSGTVRTFEATEGQYELRGLPAAEIQLVFRARGYASRNTGPRVYADGRHRIDVELIPSRSLELRITNGRGVPYKHGRIQVFDSANVIVPLNEGILWTSEASIRAGKATLRGVPAEPLTLKIAVPGADGRFELHEVSVDLTHSLPEPYPIAVE